MALGQHYILPATLLVALGLSVALSGCESAMDDSAAIPSPPVMLQSLITVGSEPGAVSNEERTAVRRTIDDALRYSENLEDAERRTLEALQVVSSEVRVYAEQYAAAHLLSSDLFGSADENTRQRIAADFTRVLHRHHSPETGIIALGLALIGDYWSDAERNEVAERAIESAQPWVERSRFTAEQRDVPHTKGRLEVGIEQLTAML